MNDDDHTAPSSTIGPDGEPLIGLIERHERLPHVRKPSPKPRLEVTPKPKHVPLDPLDVAARKVEGTDDFIRVDPDHDDGGVVYDQQVMWLIVASMSGGQWSHTLVGENVRSASFPSRRRAEGVLRWLRQQAELNQVPIAYALVPMLRHEQAI